MGPPQVSNAVRWKIIGMREAGMSLRQIAQRVGHHHSTVSCIANKHRLTNDVKDRRRSGRSRITSRREDNDLGRLVRRNPFANSTFATSVTICKNSLKSSEICWLSFQKTCKEMFTNTST
jgi:IS30 family transposase